MNITPENITETLSNAPSGVHSIVYAFKSKNGIETDEYALIHFVEKKLPLSAIPIDQVIPKTIQIDDKIHKTDVIEIPKFKALQCNSLTAPNVTFLQTYNRPLSGGIEIANLAALIYYNNQAITLGTLGFIAVDNIDNKLVAVTNSHVAILDGFNTAERDPTKQLFNTYDFLYSKDNAGNLTPIPNTTIQYGSYDSKNTNFLNDAIGRPKRYTPFTANGTNYIDCALIALSAGTVDFTSACQAELSNTYAIPFATTNEINAIINSPSQYPIYSVGRTTGPKGTNCPMQIYGSGSVNVDYNKQGSSATPNEITVTFTDILYYRFSDQSNLPIFSGDSGSAIIANINGQNKIIGLAFAGDTSIVEGVATSTFGVMCRIDRIVSQLNISSWDGTNPRFSTNTQQSISHIMRPVNDSRTSIVYNGKTYFQAGLISTRESITNA